MSADVVVLTKAQQGGGQRTFGGATTIGWEPSDKVVAVKVTVMFQGSMIASGTLDPNGTLELPYNASSGDDFTKGVIKARFTGPGNAGQLDTRGKLEWEVSGGQGSYQGFIGGWTVG